MQFMRDNGKCNISQVPLHLLKVKVTSFGRAAFSYLGVQPPFDILTSPGHWATLGNKHSGLPGETISLKFCVQPTYGTQEYLTSTDTALSGYQITHWLSGALEIHFLCPEKFTLGQCRNHGPLDLQSTHYHWTNAPRNYKILID